MEKLELTHLAAYLPYNPKFHLSLDSDRFDNITEGEPWRLAMTLEEAIKENIYGAEKYKNVLLTQIKPCIMWEEEQIFLGQMQSNLGYEEDDVFLDEVKICLRPLSHLTTEIEHNGEKFVPLDKLTEIFGGRPIRFDGNCFYTPIKKSVVRQKEDVVPLHFSQLDAFNKLFEWHFDIYNLIQKGLAIDIKEVQDDL